MHNYCLLLGPYTFYSFRICHCVQILMQIRGSVHPVHPASVTSMLHVLGLHLTCVPVIRPAATGVSVIKDTAGMG